jgi:hypothetical protein
VPLRRWKYCGVSDISCELEMAVWRQQQRANRQQIGALWRRVRQLMTIQLTKVGVKFLIKTGFLERGFRVSRRDLCRRLCLRTTPDLFCRSHRLQHAFYDLLSAGSMGSVRRFGLEKFGVCEHDAELVIQLVK